MKNRLRNRQVSVRGTTYDRLKRAAMERGVSISRLVEEATADGQTAGGVDHAPGEGYAPGRVNGSPAVPALEKQPHEQAREVPHQTRRAEA